MHAHCRNCPQLAIAILSPFFQQWSDVNALSFFAPQVSCCLASPLGIEVTTNSSCLISHESQNGCRAHPAHFTPAARMPIGCPDWRPRADLWWHLSLQRQSGWPAVRRPACEWSPNDCHIRHRIHCGHRGPPLPADCQYALLGLARMIHACTARLLIVHRQSGGMPVKLECTRPRLHMAPSIIRAAACRMWK